MMTKKEFEQKRKQWVKDWVVKYRHLDLDFEAYMLMQGITQEQYHYLNNQPEHVNVEFEWLEENIKNIKNILSTNISSKEYFQGKLDILEEIKQTFKK